MKPQKITDEKRARLIEVAKMRAQIPSYRVLAQDLGIAEVYARQVVSGMVRQIRARSNERSVSCGTTKSDGPQGESANEG